MQIDVANALTQASDMQPRVLALVLVPLLGAGVTGCQTPREARIQAQAAAFATFDAKSQELIRQGLFDLGFTREQVTMSLGKPDRITQAQTAAGPAETWVYKNVLAADRRMLEIATARARERAAVSANSAPGAGKTAAAARSEEPGIVDGVHPGMPTVHPGLATVSLDLVNGRVVSVLVEG
jgi:hypothetical protein